MTDYLWDKSGEADEDVRQLEELLGTLRHEPRPLQLPEEWPARTAHGKFRPQRSWQWQRWAVAASLLLTLGASAWLVTRFQERAASEVVKQEVEKRVGATQGISVAVGNNAPEHAQEVAQTNAPAPPTTNAAQTNEPKVARVNYRRPARVSSSAGARRRAPRDEARQPREQIAHNASPSQETLMASLTPEQRAATEQLLLALRIASTRLNDANRLMHEMSDARRADNK
jgi:hypothetical protein